MGQSLREENPPYEKFLYSDRKDLCRSLSLMTPVSRTGGLWEIQMPSTPLQPVTLGGLSPARIRMLATLQVLLDDGSMGGGGICLPVLLLSPSPIPSEQLSVYGSLNLNKRISNVFSQASS